MRLVAALPLALAVVVFARGAWRLRRVRRPALGAGRMLAAAVAFVALGVALCDAVHAFGHTLFTAHMAQHLLLVSIAAPALLLADPFGVVLWGLPGGLRRVVGRALAPHTLVRRTAASATRMTVTWPLYVLVLWLWHLPGPYDAALRSGPLHDLEHVLFFAAALLFWWPVVGRAPRLAPPAHPAARIAYLVLGALSNGALGLILSTRDAPLYAAYTLDDQSRGGVLMWTVGSAVDMAAVLLVVAQVLSSPAFVDPSVPVRDN